MDRRQEFAAQLTSLLIERGAKPGGGALKRHTFREGQYGEWSLSSECGSFVKEDLIEESRSWPLRITRCETIGDRLHLFLDRGHAIGATLNDFKRNKSSSNVPAQLLRFEVEDGSEEDLSHERAKLTAQVAERLARFNGYRICENDNETESQLKLSFLSKSNSKTHVPGIVQIVCGPVLDHRTGSKQQVVSAKEYLEKRVIDMKLKAQHRYRVIVSDEAKWNESLLRLGKSCVTIDLLQIKPSHSVQINMTDGGTGCSKGAPFMLYNSARLSSIIQTFEEKVAKGVYPPLPNLDSMDFSILNDEDEWNMIYNYIMDYPAVIENSFTVNEKTCIVSPHKLCSYLNDLVGRFSMYYRRIRILLEPRDHLLPKVFARIYLLMTIRDIISSVLSMFDIEILLEM